MSIPGQPGYTPYSSPYSGPQYDYLGGYRNYMPPNPYAQNQPLNGQNPAFSGVQQPQPTNNIQFALIPSREVAQNATAEKGQTIYMMNQNNPEIYMKAADGFGLQSTRYFKLVEFNPEQENQQAQQMMQQNADYIPREEFNRFVNIASAEIESLKQQILNIPQSPVVPQTQTNVPPQVTEQPATKKSNSSKDSK